VAVRVDAALLATALLPVAGLLLAQVSHAYVPRYSLPAVVGLAVLLPEVVFARVKGNVGRAVLCGVLMLVGVWYGVHQALRARREGGKILAGLSVLPTAAAIPSDRRIYVQNLARYLVDRHYAPAGTGARLVAFYSQACELHWSGRDPSSLFARNIAATTAVPAVPFSTLTEERAPQWVLVYHDPDEEWIWRELKQEGADVRRLGPALGGELLEVRFGEGKTCEVEAPRQRLGTVAEQDREK